jgi:Ferritin-like domain
VTTLRRRVFLGGTAAAAGGLLVACGDSPTRSTAAAPASAANRAMGRTDADIATLAAGLELLLAGAYRSLRERLDGGAFGRVPPAMGEYVRVAMTHHEEHGRLWQDVLHKAGRPAVTRWNPQLAPAVERQLEVVSNVDEAARLAYSLEEVAADTYLRSMVEAPSPETGRAAARIGIVEQEHQAFLLLAIGNYPAPDSLMRPDKAVTP